MVAASPDRVRRYRRGRFSELVAAAALLAKGYRILARRCRTPYGEIDLIAVRGRRRHPRYRDHDLGLDAILVMPGRLPLHLPDALQP
jgi:Holliday junction resolvase-like predicted endonuclease